MTTSTETLAEAYEKTQRFDLVRVVTVYSAGARALCRAFVALYPEFSQADDETARHGAKRVVFCTDDDIELRADPKTRTFETKACADTKDQLVIHEAVFQKAPFGLRLVADARMSRNVIALVSPEGQVVTAKIEPGTIDQKETSK